MSDFLSLFVTTETDEYGELLYQPTTAGFTVLVVLLLLFFLLGCCLFGKKRAFDVRQLTFSAMAIALSTLCSFIKIIHMPMGGSVTLLSMFFVTLIGYWYGIGAGLTASIAYGILQLVIGPYILSVPQMLIDYIFAFGALGLSGIFNKNKSRYGMIISYLTGVLGRYVFTFLSGWIFFGIYASDYGFRFGAVYSLAYNGAYLGLEAVITVVILALPPVNQALRYVKGIAVGEKRITFKA